MVNPESSHVRIGWISVISVDFSVISVDFSWYQLISVDISGIPVFPSVISHCSGISAVWYQLISVWYQLISVDISWYQLISVGYQFPPLWYHTLNLISPWIKLISNLMIQGFNPCIKRKSHRKLVWYLCIYIFMWYHTRLLFMYIYIYVISHSFIGGISNNIPPIPYTYSNTYKYNLVLNGAWHCSTVVTVGLVFSIIPI